MIYFARIGAAGPIKIGKTIDLGARLEAHARDYGMALTVLAVIDGGVDLEYQVHRRFAHLSLNSDRMRGRVELFAAGADLLEFIAGLDSFGSHGVPYETEGDSSMSNERMKHFRLPEDLRKRLDAESERTGAPATEIIRRALARYLSEREERHRKNPDPTASLYKRNSHDE